MSLLDALASLTIENIFEFFFSDSFASQGLVYFSSFIPFDLVLIFHKFLVLMLNVLLLLVVVVVVGSDCLLMSDVVIDHFIPASHHSSGSDSPWFLSEPEPS